MRSTLLLLLSGALATGQRESPSQQVDARALCHQLAQASASSPEKISGDYENQCLIVRGVRPLHDPRQIASRARVRFDRPHFVHGQIGWWTFGRLEKVI
jgi:hypothetical protein